MKRGSTFGIFVVVILIILLSFLSYVLYLNWPRDAQGFTQTFSGSRVQGIANYSSTSEQFYDSMRYQDRFISYFISDDCNSKKRDSMLEAFSIIEGLTVLEFSESSDAELTILCSDIAPDSNQKDFLVAGEGGPSKVINASLYSVILEGKIALYRDESCDSAKVSVHELLHSLGFAHNENPNSILYPSLDCEQQIDKKVIDEINSLYSVPPLADLYFFRVDASKRGRYLDFEVEVLNQGLLDAENVELTLYAGGKKIQDFNLEKVEIGSRKVLTVTDLGLRSLSVDEIRFVIDDSDNVDELSEENNEIILTVG